MARFDAEEVGPAAIHVSGAVDSSEPMWDVLSKRDPNTNEALLGNCTLIVGEVALQFKDGTSVCPESKVPLALSDERVKVPGWSAAAGSTESVGEEIESIEEELETDLDATLAEDDAAVGAVGATVPELTGKAALTDDGNPRCQAVKADGSQCTNAASDGSACGLSSHQAQLN